MGAGAEPAGVERKDHGAGVTTSALKTPALLTRLQRGRIASGQPPVRHSNARRGTTSDVWDGLPPGVPRWFERMLRIPLPMKLVGANVLLLLAATITAVIVRRGDLSSTPIAVVIGGALITAVLANIALVTLAVRPITVLEKTVDTIWNGNLDARVPASLLADRHVARVARMLNILLDGLVADRARTRKLAAELINAGDRERAAMSRELHDSTAQSLAALVMQLSVVAHCMDDIPPEVLRERLENATILATTTLEEVRLLAHTMHPRVLDDLGLVAALRRLARETTTHADSYGSVAGDDGMEEIKLVEVIAKEGCDEIIPATVASVLYRVAQEAVQNARRHAAPQHVEIRVRTDTDDAIVEITDDGVGFDTDAARPNQTGIGLFTMRERVALMDGELRITSGAGGGTSVVACVPLLRSTPVSNRTEQMAGQTTA